MGPMTVISSSQSLDRQGYSRINRKQIIRLSPNPLTRIPKDSKKNWLCFDKRSPSRPPNTMSFKRSGLQQEVLHLYRRALRMVNTKPPSVQPKFLLFVRYTFHMNALKVSPRNVSFIEHLLRKGRRQIESYEDPGVKDCWLSEEMVNWDKSRRMLGNRTARNSGM